MNPQYNLDNINVENLPVILGYELDNLTRLTEAHESLESYRFRVQANRLTGKEYDDCISLCNSFNTDKHSISTESRYTVSMEFIMTAILVAVGLVVAMIFAAIWKIVSVIRRLKKSGMSPDDFKNTVNKLGITKLDNAALDRVIADFTANKASNLKIVDVTPSVISSWEGTEHKDTSKLLVAYRKAQELIGRDASKDTVNMATQWAADIGRYGAWDALSRNANSGANKDYLDSVNSLKVFSYDLKKFEETLATTSDTILAAQRDFDKVTSGQVGKTYQEAIRSLGIIDNNVSLIKDQISADNSTYSSKPDLGNFKTVNERIKHGFNDLFATTETIIKDFDTSKDPKEQAKRYVEPLVKRLTVLESDNKGIQHDSERFGKMIPRVAAEWIKAYGTFTMDIERYKKFLAKYAEIIEPLLEGDK